jgi:hypothetical protein
VHIDDLKVGGTFSTRTTFTNVLNSWLVGSFGDKSRYIIYRSSGCYTWSTSAKPVTVGVTIQVHIHRKTVKGKKIATGCPVSITQWTRCDCETLPTTIVSLPSVGDTFSSRHQFTTAIAKYCSTNRTCLYATDGHCFLTQRRLSCCWEQHRRSFQPGYPKVSAQFVC